MSNLNRNHLLIAVLWLLLPYPGYAQSTSEQKPIDDVSHRFLELPNGGTGDILQQLNQLRQLQQMLQGGPSTVPKSDNAAKANSQNASDGDKAIDANSGMLKMLQDAMKQFGGQLPPGFSPESIPPEVIAKVMADPQARQQIQKMLEQFSRSRQMPQGTGNSGGPELPGRQNSGSSNDASRPKGQTDDRSNSNKPSGNPASNKDPNGDVDSADKDVDAASRNQLNGRPPLPEGSETNPNSEPPSDASPAPDEKQTSKGDSWRDKFRKMMDGMSGKSTSPNEQKAPIDSAEPSGEAATDAMTDEQWAEKLERLIQQQRDSVKRGPGQQNSPGAPGRDSRSAQNSGTPSIPHPSPEPNGELPLDPQEFAQLLKKFKEVFPEGFPESDASGGSMPFGSSATDQRSAQRNGGDSASGNSGAEIGRFNAERRPGNDPSMSPSEDGDPTSDRFLRSPGSGDAGSLGFEENAARAATAAAERARLQEQTRSSLEEKGISGTLKQMLRDAKKKVVSEQQASASPDPNGGDSNDGNQTAGSSSSARSSGFEGSLMKTLDGIRKDIVEIAKDAKFKAPAENESGRPRQGDSGQGQSDSMLNTWGRSATDFLADAVASPPKSAADTASPNASAELPELLAGNGLLFAVVFGSLAVLAAYAAWKIGLVKGVADPARSVRLMSGETIRSKADVVQAFHRLALHPTCSAEQWWTYQRVAQQMNQNVPDHEEAVAVLSSLYEAARYLPDDMEFTDQQIQLARQALKQCAS